MRFLYLLLFLLPIMGNAQPKTDAFLRNIFDSENDSLLSAVLNQPDTFRYQVIYTKIEREKNNKPTFTNYYLNVDPTRYFNPASVVKMPLAFLSLEKLNEMKVSGVDMNTTILFDSAWHKQTILHTDSTSATGKPLIAHFIRKAFLISDNDAYNRMYEFLGQETINRRLHNMGYSQTRIIRRFRGMTTEENRYTNPIRFMNSEGKMIYQQPQAYNRDSFDFSKTIKMGNAHYDSRDSLVYAPIDFTRANNYPLEDMQQQLQVVMFPNDIPEQRRFRLTEKDYDYLYRYLSQYPSESAWPKYDTAKYYDSYVKFFFKHGSHRMPPHVRVFNKVGWAYGCLTDVSYVADFENNIEFMLAVTIYVNSDGILNDDRYEYESIGWPFMYKIGQAIYKHELKRTRKFRPDLSRFRLSYAPRPVDDRPVISEADN